MVGVDKNSDIAVIKIDAKDLPVVDFGEAARVRQGDVAVAIGIPLAEYGSFITNGIISSISRKVKTKDIVKVVRRLPIGYFKQILTYTQGVRRTLCNEAGEVMV